jgi:tRNA A58 N-methylase Trm61
LDITTASSRESFFGAADPSSCRVETQGGTVYWLSAVQEDGSRWVVREHLQSSDTNTKVVQSSWKGGPDLGDKFRVKLGADIQVGQPLLLDVLRGGMRIQSEAVVTVEIGCVPSMLFG